MLLRFRCKNFRSIREEQKISFVATKTRTDERNDSLLNTPIKGVKALRCAALYGANASGKSNMLRAMRAFSRIVSGSQRQWEPTGDIPAWDPFALDEVSRQGDTEFQVDFVLGTRVFNYGFRFNQVAFIEEWLKETTKREKQIFRRVTNSKFRSHSEEQQDFSISVDFPGRNLGATSEDSKHLDTIKRQTRPNSLFLSAAAQGHHELLSTIFKWIIESFRTISSLGLGVRTADYCSTRDRKEQIKELLRFADLGVVDIEVGEEETPADIKKFEAAIIKALEEVQPGAATNIGEGLPGSRKNVKMFHRVADGTDYPLELSQESDGTRAYFSMLGPLLDVLREGNLALIDELEKSLHPHLARQLVRIFNDPALNPKGAQLMFATHDTNLLDLTLLRRDQIWLTAKNQDGATVLIPLSDYKPRKDQNIEIAYLHGRFGAVPYLDERWLQGALEVPAYNLSDPILNNEAP